MYYERKIYVRSHLTSETASVKDGYQGEYTERKLNDLYSGDDMKYYTSIIPGRYSNEQTTDYKVLKLLTQCQIVYCRLTSPCDYFVRMIIRTHIINNTILFSFLCRYLLKKKKSVHFIIKLYGFIAQSQLKIEHMIDICRSQN